MIKILSGNLFQSKSQTLVNTVNCVGIMGKGIAKEFKDLYPLMFSDYQARCNRGEVVPGKPYYYSDLTGASIVMFPTKDHWKSSSRLSYISDGLDWFIANYQKLGITSIAFPPLGCGNGGLLWKDVGPLMYGKLKNIVIPLEIYAPFGTPSSLMTKDFLDKDDLSKEEIVGFQRQKVNKNWYVAVYVVDALEKSAYSLPVGRTIFQKICYVLSVLGTDLGFNFSKNSFGPFSQEAVHSISILANSNVLIEKQVGRAMMLITKNPGFKIDFMGFSPKEQRNAKLTVDLFSRVKNTDQAELLATILFAYNDLKKSGSDVSFSSIKKYALNWKPHWDDSVMYSQLENGFSYLFSMGFLN